MLFVFLSIFIPLAGAGDEMKAGAVLKEDSYVFTMQEADTLKTKIEELEKKEKLLLQYQELSSLRLQQNEILKNSITLKDQQISLYKEVASEREEQIKIINRNKKTDLIANSLVFVAGIIFAGASIYTADKLDDSLEN